MDEKRRDRHSKSKSKVVWISSVTAAALLVGSLAYAGAFESDKDPTAGKPSPTEQAQAATDDPTVEEFADMSDQELVDNVSYYNEISTSKDQILQQNQQAVEVVKQKAGNQAVKADLDNQQFRDQVKATATNLDQLSPQEKQAIIKFVKDVGRYENKLNNKRIRQLIKKAKTKGLTKEERMELFSLLPLKNPGTPLKPGPDKGKPGDKPDDKQPPAKEPGDKPGDKEPPAKEPGDKPGDKQPPAKKPGDEEPDDKEPPAKEPGDEKPGDKEPPAKEPGDEEPGDEEPPAEEPGDEEPGDEEPPVEEPGDKEPGDEEPPAEEPGDEEPGDEEPPAEEPKPITEKNGYDRQKAVDYAYKWWNKRNNAQYGYYSKVSGGCYACWYDCTNFVSQVIKTGGIKQKTGRYDWYDYWYYTDKQPALTWGVAHSFYKHMSIVRKAQNTDSISQLKVGDIISVDFEKDGSIDHSVVITKIKNGRVYATYHSSDNKDKDITEWLTAYKVYAFKMETVKN